MLEPWLYFSLAPEFKKEQYPSSDNLLYGDRFTLFINLGKVKTG